MKVLKRVEKTHKFTCTNCQSELEAEASDLMFRSWESGDYDRSEYYFVCEVCKEEHKLKDEKIFSVAAYSDARTLFHKSKKF